MDKLENAIDVATQMHRSSYRLMRLLRALPSDRGYGLARLTVLVHLGQQGGCTAKELAQYLRIRPQSMTRMMAKMEEDGHITRRLNPKDRRQTLITGTTHRQIPDRHGNRAAEIIRRPHGPAGQSGRRGSRQAESKKKNTHDLTLPAVSF